MLMLFLDSTYDGVHGQVVEIIFWFSWATYTQPLQRVPRHRVISAVGRVKYLQADIDSTSQGNAGRSSMSTYIDALNTSL